MRRSFPQTSLARALWLGLGCLALAFPTSCDKTDSAPSELASSPDNKFRLGCHAPTGDNVYSTEKAARLQPNLDQPVTWYYGLIGGSHPIVFSLFIVSPLTLCGRFRAVAAVLEYYSKTGANGSGPGYKAVTGMAIVDTASWDDSKPFSLTFTASGTTWELKRETGEGGGKTSVSVGDVSFEFEDNDSMYPQGVAPTSFNRASEKGYSTSYVTSFLNARASGTIEGETFSNAFAYLEQVDTADFSPSTPTSSSTSARAETSIDWACVYILNENEALGDVDKDFLFQGCAHWNGDYSPFTIGTLRDANGKRSGFTNPGFKLKPVADSLFTSVSSGMEFHSSYEINIRFGDTSFQARTVPLIPDADLGVGVKGAAATYIQPVSFVDADGNPMEKVSGILEQVRFGGGSPQKLMGRAPPLLSQSFDALTQLMNEHIAANP